MRLRHPELAPAPCVILLKKYILTSYRNTEMPLNGRELQVIQALSSGNDLYQYAELVGISLRSAAFLLGCAFDKLGAKTIEQAAAEAKRRGLL